MTDRIRILIADDHMMVRAGLVQMLERGTEIEIVGEATTGEEAIHLAQQVRPDIVLMDVRMQGLDGIEATRAISQAETAKAVIGLSTFSDPEQINAMRDAGARGYVLKEALTEDILHAIRHVHQGGSLFPENIPQVVETTRLPTNETPDIGVQQRRILALMTKGLTNPEIAGQLGTSRATVSYHVSAILRKLDVSNRAEAVALAVRNALVSDQDC